jgi:hypothetical protein
MSRDFLMPYIIVCQYYDAHKLPLALASGKDLNMKTALAEIHRMRFRMALAQNRLKPYGSFFIESSAKAGSFAANVTTS